ncbi:conserved Plasmodium protein, unknown function [Plasmodium relictum]|uniref:Uncharacterized protein n=1 Tax=Plasmodium relictum TaxID=85471 RepID=A0A1J1H5Y9_PLARL|nr:conserved Plasmodium protein, unknown function [Plasmodium relictum]CRH00350.1 conserved Plasmodium protein, unknown function [Plasmodium relictum]
MYICSKKKEMSHVKSYRFRKKAPNLKSDLENNKDSWSEFIKYMNNLKNISNYPSKNNEDVFNSYNEGCININENELNENDMNENIDDIIKLKKWNDIQIDNHSIHKESSSDIESNSNSSSSVFSFNKYNIIQNNIYSNNANFKRQRIKNYSGGYKPNENYEIEENDSFSCIKNKKGLEFNDHRDNSEMYKNNKLQKKMYFKNNIKNNPKSSLKNRNQGKKLNINNHKLHGTNIYSKFADGNNKDESDNEKDYMNINTHKQNNKYEQDHYSRIVQNKEKKLKKNHVKKKKKIENNLEIDGSYAYNYAYLNKNDESSMSSPIETVNNTIMNLEEEINNYQFNNFI